MGRAVAQPQSGGTSGRDCSPHGAASAKSAQLALEQRHVDRVNARIVEMRGEATELLQDALRQINVGTYAARVDRDVRVAEAERRIRILDAAHDDAVFGRLDLTEGPPRYIARIGVRTAEQEPLAVDWRAPAAEPFYQATPEDTMGVVRRRVLHTRLGRVIDIEDDLVDPDAAPSDMSVVGDGAFIASLARSRDGRMRDVVATIQRDQDEVVRAPADATVVLRGGPGTGKTVVALHRVAWLLFHHRRRFGSRGVLVIGPNPRFTSYIERVLPSLGEEGAVLRSLGDVLPGLAASHYDEASLAALKGGAHMTRLLRQAARSAPPGVPRRLRLVHRGTVFTLDESTLSMLRARLLRGRQRPNELRPRAVDALLGAAWRRYGAVVTGAGDTSPGEDDHERFLDDVRDQSTFREFVAAWWPARSAETVLRELSDTDRLRGIAGRNLRGPEIEALAASWRRLDEDGYSYQDVALLDELADLLGEPPKPRPSDVEDETEDGLDDASVPELTTYADRLERQRAFVDEEQAPREFGHIVVDEAQDLSPMQWRMLGRRGRHATWTVVTDDAQRSWEDAAGARAAMDAAVGGRRRLDFELTVNYRNPTEIADVAARLLRMRMPDAVPARAVRGSGRPPEIVASGASLDALSEPTARVVDRLLDEVDGVVGVIMPTTLSTDRPVETGTSWPERVQVLGPLEAKGLEFDAVVLVAPARIADESPSGERTLYVAVTRATRALVTVGPLGDTLSRALRDATSAPAEAAE